MSNTTERARVIADRMRFLRRRAGLSQEDVARKLGVTVRTYARWERSETLGHLPRLNEIASALGSTEGELAEGTDAPTSVSSLEQKVDRVLALLEGLYGKAEAREALAAALADEESP